MVIRGTTRRYFQKDPVKNPDYGGFGVSSSKDLIVAFKGNRLAIDPGSLYQVTNLLRSELTWSGGLDDKLGVFIVEHNASMDLNGFDPRTDILDYEKQIVDLNWIKIAEVRNSVGGGRVKLPNRPSDEERGLVFHLMLRSLGAKGCFYFDILPFVQFDLNV
jgi:hypothetical protein